MKTFAHSFRGLRLLKAVMLAVLFPGAVALLFYWQAQRAAMGRQPILPAGEKSATQPRTGMSEASTSREGVAQALKSARSPAEARTILNELRSHLAKMPPGAASQLVCDLLNSKEDARTQLSFKLGADGLLIDAPTLRTFLMNELARVDPAGAAAYAEKVLATMNSPDEWALALRSYALANATPQGRAFLEGKLQQMLLYQSWQDQPSVGFLEAFDVAVYLGGTNLLPLMTGFVRQTENQAVAHAAYLALDRLTISDPASTLAKLVDEPELMKGRELTRANYFARADVSDLRQRTVLENYLLNPQLSSSELGTFAGLYPNANYMISYNLLTRTQTPDHETLVRQDREALTTVEAWLTDARFEKLQPQLQRIAQRLQGFVKQR